MSEIRKSEYKAHAKQATIKKYLRTFKSNTWNHAQGRRKLRDNVIEVHHYNLYGTLLMARGTKLPLKPSSPTLWKIHCSQVPLPSKAEFQQKRDLGITCPSREQPLCHHILLITAWIVQADWLDTRSLLCFWAQKETRFSYPSQPPLAWGSSKPLTLSISLHNTNSLKILRKTA